MPCCCLTYDFQVPPKTDSPFSMGSRGRFEKGFNDDFMWDVTGTVRAVMSYIWALIESMFTVASSM